MRQTKVYLVSPHIDDAVFSLGAYITIMRKHYQLLVINLFSQTNFAYESIISTKEATSILKCEDKEILELLGVEHIYYADLPNALLRGYTLHNIFAERDSYSSHDKHICQQIKIFIENLVQPESILFIPSGFGSHIDHLLARDACENLNATKIYYADLPYASSDINYANTNANLFLINKKKEKIHINKEDIDLHIDLCRAYKSQFLNRFVQEMSSYLINNHYTVWKN